MAGKMTKVAFAQSCVRLGRFAAQWGADSLDLIDAISQEELPETVFRFTDEMRSRLRYLDECAGRSALEAADGK